jgi:hypothetical protein
MQILGCHPDQPNTRRRVTARDELEPDHPKCSVPHPFAFFLA